jgi:predicted XRE-type DNA-binding protein
VRASECPASNCSIKSLNLAAISSRLLLGVFLLLVVGWLLMVVALLQQIEQHGFTQAYLVTTLKAHQPDVSNLLRGKIERISITKLIQFAARLNLEARGKVTSPKATGKTLPPLTASKAKADS